MSKDTPDLHNLPLTESAQAQQDSFHSFLNAPVSKKLDADEYTANDLDGGTETLLGSGNMNFLMMQAGQTNESMANSNPFDANYNADAMLPSSVFSEANNAPFATSPYNDLSSDRSYGMPSSDGGPFDGAGFGGGFNNMTGSLGASGLAANTFSAKPLSGTDGLSGISGTSGTSGTDGTNGFTPPSPINGTNGNNGLNGVDGNDGTGTTIINNEYNEYKFIEINEFPFDLGPVGISLDLVLSNISNLTLDVIRGDQIINVINEVLPLEPILAPIIDLTGELLSSVSLDVILDPFQYDSSPNDFDLHVGTGIELLGIKVPDLALDVPLDPIEGLLGDLDISLDLNNILLGGLLPPLSGSNADTDLALGGLDQIIPVSPILEELEPLTNLVEDLTGDLDIVGQLGLGLLGTNNNPVGAMDTDIVIPVDLSLVGNGLLGDTINISLDPVESLLGDIDLDLAAAGNLLGDLAPNLIDSELGGSGTANLVDDLGDIASGLVGDILPFSNDAGDTDIALDTTLDVIGGDLLNDGMDIVLDPVENILGDVDLGITGRGDVLENILTGGLAGGDYASPTDTDLTIQIDLVDAGLPPIDLPVNLDLVESITGDIDLGVDLNTEIVSNVLDTIANPLDLSTDTILGSTLETIGNAVDSALGLISSLPENTGGLDLGALIPSDLGGGGDPVSSWTENILPDPGNLLGGGLLGGLDSIVSALPDPISSGPTLPVPVVPMLPVVPVIHVPHFGGLFG